MLGKPLDRVAIIGNGGGGKTTLARALAHTFGLPLTHVDSIQYLPGMKVRPIEETSQMLLNLARGPRWIIDGFGSLEVMRDRFRLADRVVFVDLPLWRHYLWATKRQLGSYWRPRRELPEGCVEASLAHTWRLYKILWRVHHQIRPQLIALFEEPAMKSKVKRVRSVRELKSLPVSLLQGLPTG